MASTRPSCIAGTRRRSAVRCAAPLARRPASTGQGPSSTTTRTSSRASTSTTCGMMAPVPGIGSVITAIVTPFDERLEVDEEAFVELMAHLARHGSDGFVFCATTGEPPPLSADEHLRLVELAARERPEGPTVIAGTGSNDTRHACHMTERATQAGADAILSVTPYYNKTNPRGRGPPYEENAPATRQAL